MTDIRLVRNGRRAELVLDRPAKRNALTRAMWSAIPGLLAAPARDPEVRLLVVRGAGGVFSGGADIGEFPETFASGAAALESHATMREAMAVIEDFPRPVVALIEGACVGGGCAIALACDIRIAGADARLGVTPAKLGLAYGVADTRRLVQAVGLSMAKDILFTGRLLPADEALRIGLVDRLAADPASELAALERDLLAASGDSARAQKDIFRLLREGARDDDARGAALFAAALDGPDFKEGHAAFMEKRPPRFA